MQATNGEASSPTLHTFPACYNTKALRKSVMLQEDEEDSPIPPSTSYGVEQHLPSAAADSTDLQPILETILYFVVKAKWGHHSERL